MQINQHIGVFKNFVPSDVCDGLVQAFERAKELNYTYTRQESEPYSKLYKADAATNPLQPEVFEAMPFGVPFIQDLMDRVWGAYTLYANAYDVLSIFGKHVISSVKLQKTRPTEGYHLWHGEASGLIASRRVLAYIVYLNDVEDGGETEFLYQSMRVKPTKGTVVIFPASYTHTHRGNPPLSGDKYIATSWFEFIE